MIVTTLRRRRPGGRRHGAGPAARHRAVAREPGDRHLAVLAVERVRVGRLQRPARDAAVGAGPAGEARGPLEADPAAGDRERHRRRREHGPAREPHPDRRLQAPALQGADEDDRAAAERRAGQRPAVLERAGRGGRDVPGLPGDRDRVAHGRPVPPDGTRELVGVLELVLGDRRAARRAEHERALQPPRAVPPALRQRQAPAEAGQLAQREVRIDDLRQGLHDVDVAAGGDELEHRAPGAPAPDVPAGDRPVRVGRPGQVGRGADRDGGDLRQLLPVEGPHPARPGARRVHEEAARPVEHDERRAELLGQGGRVEAPPPGLGAAVPADRVPDLGLGRRRHALEDDDLAVPRVAEVGHAGRGRGRRDERGRREEGDGGERRTGRPDGTLHGGRVLSGRGGREAAGAHGRTRHARPRQRDSATSCRVSRALTAA